MYGNIDVPAAQNSTQNANFTLVSILSKVKLNYPNNMDRMRNMKMNIRYKNKEYVLENPLIEIDEMTTTPDEIAFYNTHHDDTTKVACIMVVTMHLSSRTSIRNIGHMKCAFILLKNFTRK